MVVLLYVSVRICGRYKGVCFMFAANQFPYQEMRIYCCLHSCIAVRKSSRGVSEEWHLRAQISAAFTSDFFQRFLSQLPCKFSERLQSKIMCECSS